MLVDVDGGAGDAMARVAAFLPWEDLAVVTRCSRALRDPETSAFYHAWLATSTLVLPPDSRVTHDVLSMVKDIDAVVVPHSKWLDMALRNKSLAPRLARVHRVKLDPWRYLSTRAHALDLGVIAQAFPSTTHFTIREIDYLDNTIEGVRAFRGGLRCLDISFVHGIGILAFDISTVELSSLEELKLTRVKIQNVESMSSLINLRSLEINEVGSIRDLSFLRQLPTLTRLILQSTTVAGPAVRDLLEAAPRLTHFACKQVESIWPSDATTGRVDGPTLALAFKKLESLTIEYGARRLDLSCVSLISSLRELHVSTVDDIRPLRNLVRLERLRFRTTTRVDLTPLAELPHLVSINHLIEFDGEIGTASVSFPQLRSFAGPLSSLQQMCELDNLRSLRVVSSSDSQRQLPHASLSRLHTLVIPRNIDVSSLYFQFPHLRELQLTCDGRRSPPLSELLAQVARLQDLESLDLDLSRQDIEFESLSALDFQRLAALPKLRKLNLGDPSITSLDGIEKLVELRELRMLYMSPTLDLAPLEKLPHLQVLLIPNIYITDTTAITRMPSLRVVELSESVDCCEIVIAYHAHRMRLPGAPARLDLQLLKQTRISDNCHYGWGDNLWGKYYHSKRVRDQLKAMRTSIPGLPTLPRSADAFHVCDHLRNSGDADYRMRK